jgi:hypothetical protein
MLRNLLVLAWRELLCFIASTDGRFLILNGNIANFSNILER